MSQNIETHIRYNESLMENIFPKILMKVLVFIQKTRGD